MSGRMERVELLEEPAPEQPGTGRVPEPRAGTRAPVRYAALVGAAALVAGLLAQSAWDRTRADHLAGVSGLTRVQGTGLRTLWEVGAGDRPSLLGGTVVDGVLVSPRVDDSGTPVGVAGTDPDTGGRLWTAEPPWSSSGGGDVPYWLDCGRDGDRATCLAQAARGYLAWSLDPATGRVLHARELPQEVATALVDGRVWVLAGFDAQGAPKLVWEEPDRLRLSVLDLPGDGTRWTWDVPVSLVGARWSATIVGDGTLIARGDSGWYVRPDGTATAISVRPAAGPIATGRAGELVQEVYSPRGHGRLLGADGTWRDVPGTPLALTVDDGSAPGVELLRGGSDVTGAAVAVDAATGDELWRLAGGADQGVLLDGRLFLARDTALTALDARTGAVLWAAELPDAVTGLGSDGYSLLVASRHATVEALGLRDGRRLWRVDAGAVLRGPGGTWSGERVRLDLGVPHVVVVRRDGSAGVLG